MADSTVCVLFSFIITSDSAFLPHDRGVWRVSLLLPAWFSSWWGWSQSSSTPNAAPPRGQRWHARCHRPQPAGCHLQTRPGWTRCLCWASPTRTTTVRREGERERKEGGRENNIVNGYRYLSTILNNYLGGWLMDQERRSRGWVSAYVWVCTRT